LSSRRRGITVPGVGCGMLFYRSLRFRLSDSRYQRPDTKDPSGCDDLCRSSANHAVAYEWPPSVCG